MFSYRDVTTLYVAPNGAGNGKTAQTENGGNGPFGSLDAAFSAVEQMRGGGMLQPVTVKLLAGTYCFSGPLQVRARMSHITVEPYGNGDVILSGGRKITGFARAEFNGVPCFAAEIPEVKNGTYRFTDLYVDGRRADFTRYPEEGYLHMTASETPETALFASSKWFETDIAACPLLATMYAPEDAIVSFNHYWIDEHTPIASFDRETGRVTMEYYSRFNIRPGQEFILENVAEAFGKPNQWYLDRQNGMLYYIPRSADQTPDSIDVWAPVASKLLEINGSPDDPCTALRFRNLTFAYTRGDYGSAANVDGHPDKLCASDAQAVANAHGSLSVRYADHISFEDCVIRNFGVHGVDIREGCHQVKIEGCTFLDGGAGGIRICGGAYGAPLCDMTDSNTVSDCKILHCGRRYLSACGILLMHTASNDVIHNEIGDLYYTGISCGWTWGYARTVCHDNRILWNHIYNLGQGLLSDMGGVYLLGSQPGTVVAYNRIHDIKCKDYGGWALYTDEGSAGITLECNLCYRTSSNGYHQHYGTSNVVRNNIFADAGDSLLRVSRPEAHLSILFTNNILYSTGTPMLAAYAQSANGAYSICDGAIVSHDNLFWSVADAPYSDDPQVKTLEDAKAKGMEEGSTFENPLFRDPANDDYTLSPDSPAFAHGFRPFDYTKCGVRERASV